MAKKMKQDFLYLFSDGACQNNPGRGGWGSLILDSDGLVTEIGGFENLTTNNKMELRAICEGLSFVLKSIRNKKDLHVYTDSKYVVEGVNKWLPAWVKSGWITAAKKEVQNQELWKRLLSLLADLKEERKIFFHHVPAHVGLVLNERVDKIASTCAEKEKNYFYEKELINYPYKESLKTLGSDIEKAKGLKSKLSEHKKKIAFSYVSLVEGKVETHKTWADCEARVKGAAFARFKKASSKEEEEEIIRNFNKS